MLQQFNTPAPRQADSKQRILILFAIVGGVLGVVLLLASALLGGKSTEPQMTKALESLNQATVAHEIIQTYETTPAVTNLAATIKTITASDLGTLYQLAATNYPELTYAPVRKLDNVRESLDSAEISGTLNSQAITISSNTITVAISSLNELQKSVDDQLILNATEAALSNLSALQDQINDL